jgi:2-iminoacetate synthase
MDLLVKGRERIFCKLNAVLTFKEWLDDFASEETKEVAQKVIEKEMEELKGMVPEGVYQKLLEYYQRIENGERDLYF